MSVIVVIPARHDSSRFPGKPLARLRQPDGRHLSLIEMTHRAARRIPGVDAVFVATDDERIAAEARRIGAAVVMTSRACRNGTERVAEACARIAAGEAGSAGGTPRIVVNLQGDAPLTPPWFVTALIEAMDAEPRVQMATPVLQCDRATHARLLEDRRAGRVGATTAVFDRQGDALYFSKEVIPFLPAPAPQAAGGPGHGAAEAADGAAPVPVWHHVGVYAYRPAALAAYGDWAPGPLEQLEGLEQLRFLEHGHKVRCVRVEARGRVFWELNNPEDIPRIEAALEAMQ